MNKTLEFERLGLLRRMRVRRASVAFQLFQHGITERTLGQHALDRPFEGAFRKALLQLSKGDCTYASGITAVAVVELVLGLGARDPNLFHVGDDDEVSGVHMRGVDSLVLPAQAMRDGTGEPPDDLVAGVDDVPVASDFLGLGDVGFHVEIPNHCDFTKSYIIIWPTEACQTMIIF